VLIKCRSDLRLRTQNRIGLGPSQSRELVEVCSALLADRFELKKTPEPVRRAHVVPLDSRERKIMILAKAELACEDAAESSGE